MLRFGTLEGIPVETIANVFNIAFADYFVPLKLTPELLQAKFYAEDIALPYSVAVFDEDKLVAFIFHCSKEVDGRKWVYNGGTGVIDSHRGQSLTTKMYDYILPILRQESVCGLVLEVIEQNQAAIRSYHKAGFQRVRRLMCFKGQVREHLRATNTVVTLRPFKTFEPELGQTFRDVEPSWQHADRVVQKLGNDLFKMGAYADDQFIGYIVFNPANKKILQLAVDREYRRQGVATSLITVTTERYGRDLAVINVDENSDASIQFFTKIGLVNSVNQLEMHYLIS